MTAALPRAVVLGDSQAQGLAPGLREALPVIGFDVVATITTVGTSTRAMLDSDKIARALEHEPALIVIALGGNDFVTERYPETLHAFVSQARSRGARVVWVGPAHAANADVEARHARTREAQRVIVPATGALWLDSVPWTHEGHSPDGVHFTRTAYAAQARAIASAIAAGGQPSSALPWIAGGLALLALGAAAWRLAAGPPGR